MGNGRWAGSSGRSAAAVGDTADADGDGDGLDDVCDAVGLAPAGIFSATASANLCVP
jgi:hypothetical protein